LLTDFLARITYADVTLRFRISGAPRVPAFSGPTLRGALGHLLRPALCGSSPVCPDQCDLPDSCRYFSLFEQSRSAAGTGHNIPKPLILLPPVPPAFESIALGGPLLAPFHSSPGSPVPILSAPPGSAPLPSAFSFSIRLLGPAAPAFPAIISGLARHGLRLPGGHIQLIRAEDSAGALFDSSSPSLPPRPPRLSCLNPAAEPARRIRIAFLTPALIKTGGSPCFQPATFAALCLEHSLVRAVRVFNTFFAPPGNRLPRLELPPAPFSILRHRLFRYLLPRISHRQQKHMHFDGLLGFLDLEGELSPVIPFLRAAEILHLGQKATFGLGRLRALILDKKWGQA
jgi:hypothetical protein